MSQEERRRIRRTANPAVLLVDNHPLTRKHLAELIRARYRNARVSAVGSFDEAAAGTADLVIVNLNDRRAEDPVVLALLDGVRGRFPGAPLTLVCGRSACHSGTPPGVRAVFPLSLPADVLVAALRLVMAGGVYFGGMAADSETQAEGTLLPLGAGTGAPDDPEVEHGLTEREHEVLELLREGHANKLIAHELHISENTVKVHVRRIIRKLKVTNRTQAAFVAAPPAG